MTAIIQKTRALFHWNSLSRSGMEKTFRSTVDWDELCVSHPVLFSLFAYIVCPLLLLFAVGIAASAVFLPFALLLGWL